MSSSFSKLSNVEKSIAVLLLVAIAIGSYLLYKNSTNKRIKAIDDRIASGKASAQELINLHLTKNALSK